MEEVLYYNDLYDLYSLLLTDKQRKYFEDYYFNNLSLSEMADNYQVSRNAISKQLHNIIIKLEDYEEKLSLYKKKDIILSLIDKVNDEKIKKELESII